MSKSKLELLSEVFSDVSGEEIIIAGNKVIFDSIKKEVESITGEQSASFDNEKKNSTFSVTYRGNDYFFVDKIEFKNLMEK